MNLVYLPADSGDIPVIFAQAKDLVDTYEDLSAIDYEKVMAWMLRKITKFISGYTCVWLNGEKCAWYRRCEDGELDDLYVLPAFQNRGIGTKIIEKCIAEWKKPLYLYVFTGNLRAISLYERHGFTLREAVGGTRLILERKG